MLSAMRARARLAVGAGDVDDRVRALGVAEQFDHPPGGVQPRLGVSLPRSRQKFAVDPVGLGLEERIVAELGVVEVPLSRLDVVIGLGLGVVGEELRVGEVAELVIAVVAAGISVELIAVRHRSPSRSPTGR